MSMHHSMLRRDSSVSRRNLKPWYIWFRMPKSSLIMHDPTLPMNSNCPAEQRIKWFFLVTERKNDKLDHFTPCACARGNYVQWAHAVTNTMHHTTSKWIVRSYDKVYRMDGFPTRAWWGVAQSGHFAGPSR